MTTADPWFHARSDETFTLSARGDGETSTLSARGDTPADAPAIGEIERWARSQGLTSLIGLDEAGRGPLAGPVVAAACALPEGFELPELADSKTLAPATRERLFQAILDGAIAYGVAVVEPAVIDVVNVLQASLWGMAVAWDQATRAAPALTGATALVDGKHRAPLPKGTPQRTFVKGDGRSRHIAAASILAKVHRDRLMVDYDGTFPGYGFAQHKGYPTAAHYSAIARLGPSPIHRRSFRLSRTPAA